MWLLVHVCNKKKLGLVVPIYSRQDQVIRRVISVVPCKQIGAKKANRSGKLGLPGTVRSVSTVLPEASNNQGQKTSSPKKERIWKWRSRMVDAG